MGYYCIYITMLMSAGYQFPVRRKSKMASVEPRLLTVKVKSPYHGQTYYVKSLAYTQPPPLQLNIDRCITS